MTQPPHSVCTHREPLILPQRYPHIHFIARFTIASGWKQPRCPSAHEWAMKTWHMYKTEHYSVQRRSEITKLAGEQINFDCMKKWGHSVSDGGWDRISRNHVRLWTPSPLASNSCALGLQEKDATLGQSSFILVLNSIWGSIVLHCWSVHSDSFTSWGTCWLPWSFAHAFHGCKFFF